MFKQNTLLNPISWLFLLLFMSLFSCQDDEGSTNNIREVQLGTTFKMVPGETVRFLEPFDYKLTLVKFDDFEKMEGTLPAAVITFDQETDITSGGLILQINEDNQENEPTFFSGCNPGFLSNGIIEPIPVYFITEEIEFMEDAVKFEFLSIRFKIIYEADNPDVFCTS